MLTHRARARLPEEGLEVSSRHEFQQDEPGQGLQTHSDTAHDVLVIELAAGQRGVSIVRGAESGNLLAGESSIQSYVFSSHIMSMHSVHVGSGGSVLSLS